MFDDWRNETRWLDTLADPEPIAYQTMLLPGVGFIDVPIFEEG